MFSSCAYASPGKKIEIYNLQPNSFWSRKACDAYQIDENYLKSEVLPNQLYVIAISRIDSVNPNIADLEYHYLAFSQAGVLHVPSIGIIQALFSLKFGEAAQTIYPVLHLSKRRDMIGRFRENKSDLALLLPDDESKLHGSVERGIYPFAHDLSHMHFRSILKKQNLVAEYMDMSALIEDCIETIPENPNVICDEFTFLFPFKNASEDDLVRWLLNEAGGRLVDGDFIWKPGFLFNNDIEQSFKGYLRDTLEYRVFLFGEDIALFDFNLIDQELLIEKCWIKLKKEINFKESKKTGKLIHI